MIFREQKLWKIWLTLLIITFAVILFSLKYNKMITLALTIFAFIIFLIISIFDNLIQRNQKGDRLLLARRVEYELPGIQEELELQRIERAQGEDIESDEDN